MRPRILVKFDERMDSDGVLVIQRWDDAGEHRIYEVVVSPHCRWGALEVLKPWMSEAVSAELVAAARHQLSSAAGKSIERMMENK